MKPAVKHRYALGSRKLFGRVMCQRSERSKSHHRTDEQGAVEVITDGVEVWVETGR